MIEFILASGSKTRAKMLKSAGVDFTVQTAPVDEASLKEALVADGAAPRHIADALAEMKARAVSFMYPEALVLGADQILVKDGKIFSKASNQQEAEATLKELSGGEHRLISAAVICQNGQAIWRSVDQVKMDVRPLSDTFIKQYLNILGDDAYWSVGCYQIEGIGAQLFNRVDGDYFTVLGMPLLPVLDFLRRYNLLPF
ncbi:septum formation protein Maf [Kordiimonas sp. SCSIO 12603]|uniref:Maf family protein n=1 Tax=Kordiimonas sp. SCSIO 12603 TaxID=2829596 RepID=UPI0021060E2F|nr:Maf family nucleotide pyrophosphatase [Kordiimonas sp. SCSIO 12603]UTW59098.1 septum formation protein Maf [Kordiimonas sp. SCSIO 12603]